MGGRMLANGGLSQAAVQPHTSVPSWPVAAARHHRKQLAGRPTSSDRMRAAGKLGRPKQLSRSHEHAPHINGCKRHPGDAAVPAPYLIRRSIQSYATTYARPFGSRRRWPRAVFGHTRSICFTISKDPPSSAISPLTGVFLNWSTRHPAGGRSQGLAANQPFQGLGKQPTSRGVNVLSFAGHNKTLTPIQIR